MGNGIWRPPQWSSQPAMVSITANTTPPTQSTPAPSSGALFQAQSYSNTITPVTYVFDAVLSLDHEQRVEKTQHPIQTGADISSHAYLMPARLTMMIGMSDAMDAYSNGFDSTKPPYITPFAGSSSKSVAAYQTLLQLQAQRQPLTVTTRLRTYKNMIITSVRPHEDNRTITGLRVTVEFEQIYTASISQTPNSARPQTTGSTGLGQVNVTPPSTITEDQFNVDNYQSGTPVLIGSQSYQSEPLVPTNVPGAGTWSSANTANLQQLSPAGGGS